MGGEYGSQIYGSRTLRTVKTPHRFRIVRIHIHCFRTVAPARGHGDGRTHTFTLELLGTGGTLTHPAYRRIRNDTLHLRAVTVPQVRLDQVLYSLGQIHRFLFQAFTDTALTTVDRRPDTNFRIVCFHCLI